MRTIVEICVQGVASALAAQAGGADRVELCEDLSVGGVTPIAGAIAVACRSLTIPVHVIVRPRGGDFCYSDVEYEVMRRDIDVVKSLGASGVVLGLLTADATIDRERAAGLIERARPLSVTFHKAFDAARDPFEALDELIALGVDRVLTSGRQPQAIDGVSLLADLTRRAGARLAIMAGGGVGESHIQPLLAAGIREIHIGSSAAPNGATDAARVRALVERAGPTERE